MKRKKKIKQLTKHQKENEIIQERVFQRRCIDCGAQLLEAGYCEGGRCGEFNNRINFEEIKYV